MRGTLCRALIFYTKMRIVVLTIAAGVSYGGGRVNIYILTISEVTDVQLLPFGGGGGAQKPRLVPCRHFRRRG